MYLHINYQIFKSSISGNSYTYQLSYICYKKNTIFFIKTNIIESANKIITVVH